MVIYTGKQSDFQEWQEAQQTTDTGEIRVTISNSGNQPLVLSASHQAPNLENIGQMPQNCASFRKRNRFFKNSNL